MDTLLSRFAVSLALSVILAGCAPAIGVRALGPEAANNALTANVLNTGEPSATAREFLYRENLYRLYEKDPPAALTELRTKLGGRDEADLLFALAELSYHYASQSGDPRFHLQAALYAWTYLFDEPAGQRPSCFDPRARAAMDIYNRSVAEGLARSGSDTIDVSARTVALPFAMLEISVDPHDLRYGGYHLDRFTSLAGLETYGLRNRYRTRGIGAPLAAAVVKTGDESVDRWIAPRAKVPKTAVLRFEDPRSAFEKGVVHAKLELYDDDETTEVTIGDEKIPLESELTASLAYLLHGSPVWDFELAGFRRGELTLAGEDRDNLFMLHPYHPGRIPVVFVHGTASSPARWAEMTNELMHDPVLRARYQFWYFVYNTGNPVAYSAWQLRKAITNAVADVDPEGKDEALRRMVVIGHSQGGLLTKLTVVSSGDRFWRAISDVPFDEAEMSDATRALLRSALFFEPVPYVKRVIFIATPHHGAMQADDFLGNLARSLVNLPGRIVGISTDIVRLESSGTLKTSIRGVPTSIDNMKSTNPFLVALTQTPIASGVHAHSIIAVNGNGPPATGNDTVVTYQSAHIEPVDSELVVRSKHSTQSTPATIEEVRRILHLHLDQE